MNAPLNARRLAAWHLEESLWAMTVAMSDFHLRAALLIIARNGSRRVRREARQLAERLDAR